MSRFGFWWLLCFGLLSIGSGHSQGLSKQTTLSNNPTVAEARAFIEEAETKLRRLSVDASRASWVQSTYITEDTEILSAQANERAIAAGVDFAKRATRFDGLSLPADPARKMKLLKVSLTLATPSDPKESQELTRLMSSM